MPAYQKFIISVEKLRSIKDVGTVMKVASEHLNLYCNPADIDRRFKRENEWGCYPAICIGKRGGYLIKIAHIGYYPDNLPSKLAAIKRKLKGRFKNTKISYLNFEKLEEL